MSFQFPDLPYDYSALSESIDAQTMEIHYDRHHRTYFNNLVNAVKDTPLAEQSIESLMANVSQHGAAVRNNGGGFYNHILYWNCMCAGGTSPDAALAADINATFGSVDALQDQLTQAGITRFGSGFAWLVVADGKLVVTSTPNQDNPLMDVAEVQGTPILALDVWEHAYYLRYQNKRPDYLKAWWSVCDWAAVSARYAAAKG